MLDTPGIEELQLFTFTLLKTHHLSGIGGKNRKLFPFYQVFCIIMVHRCELHISKDILTDTSKVLILM